MSRYKFHSEDDTCVVMTGDDGRTVRVAKTKVSPAFLESVRSKGVQAFDKGGVVTEADKLVNDPAKKKALDGVRFENDRMKTTLDKDNKPKYDGKKYKDPSLETWDGVIRFAEGGEVPEREIAAEPVATAPGPRSFNPEFAPLMSAVPVIGPMMIADRFAEAAKKAPEMAYNVGEKIGEAITVPSAPAGPSTPATDPQVGQPGRAVNLELTPAPQMPKPGVPGLGLVEKGIKEAGAAAAKQGDDSAKAYAQQETELQTMQAAYKQKRDEYEQENARLYKEVLDTKVDPGRYWGRKGTAGRISAAIGIVLAGIGSGLTKSPNAALDLLNRQIDRDVDAQKEELDAKKNLLARNLERTRDLHAAEGITRAQLTAVTAAQVAKIASTATSETARANALQLLGQLRMSAAQMTQQSAMLQAKSALGGAGAPRLNPEALSKEDRERLVDLHDGRQMLARTSDDAKQVKEQVEAVSPLMKQLERLDQLGTAALVPGSGAANKAQAIRSSLVSLVNGVQKLGRLSDKDMELIKDQIYDPTAFLQLIGGKERSKALRSLVNDALEAGYNSRLSNYRSKPRASQETPYRATTSK